MYTLSAYIANFIKLVRGSWETIFQFTNNISLRNIQFEKIFQSFTQLIFFKLLYIFIQPLISKSTSIK